MNSADILLAVGQVLGGGAVGYLTGLWQGRRQTQYQRRVEVVAELRRRMRELRESFANMATPPEYRLPEEQFGIEDVGEVGVKLHALSGYFRDNPSWLDEDTPERLDDLSTNTPSGGGTFGVV